MDKSLLDLARGIIPDKTSWNHNPADVAKWFVGFEKELQQIKKDQEELRNDTNKKDMRAYYKGQNVLIKEILGEA